MVCRNFFVLLIVGLALAGAACGDDGRKHPDGQAAGDAGDGSAVIDVAADHAGDTAADKVVSTDAGGDTAGDVAGDVSGDGTNDVRADAGDDGTLDVGADGVADVQVDTGADVPGRDGGGSCTDQIKNADETDLDCGGSCGRCALGRHCQAATDCTSGACNAAGICVDCLTATTCPGQDTECSQRTCLGGACGTTLVAAQTVLAAQVPGDCKSRRCDGQGNIIAVTDNTDLPIDQNPCTQDVCAAGVPSNPATAATVACGGGQLCDGQGHCVGCLTAADCPGTDGDCRTRTCNQNVCGFLFKAAGMLTPIQIGGDCKVNDCDGSGNPRVSTLDSDVPDDGNACTADLCTAGAPSHTPVAANTACGSGNVCDGNGRCAQCIVAATCPASNNACQVPTCSAQGVCGFAPVAAGTVLSQQSTGDCKQSQCDGNGQIVAVNDDNDKPVDNNACTADVCAAGVPSNPALPASTTCEGNKQCDGAGHCRGCLTAADCPGTDTACQARTCSSDGVCGLARLADGTATTAQVAGDCQIIVCDGNGGERAVTANADKPVDGNACTDDVCTAGVPSNPPLASGTSCGGPSQCDGVGHCVGCLTASDCPGQDTDCQARTCDANHVCGVQNVADGTPLPTAGQTTGDCKVAQCDGRGNVKSVVDATDIPNDNNACTQDVCSAGVPSNPPVASGTSCGGGDVCDAVGVCVQCLVDANCGADSDCQHHTCGANHTCGVTNTPAGTATASQTAGDCSVVQCDGLGGTITVNDDADVVDDGNVCTDDVCMAGAPTHPPTAARATCGGANICDGQGSCVRCLAAGDCGTDSACQVHTCEADRTCGVVNVQRGTPLAAQTAGDCSVAQCDGAGGVMAVNDDSDFVDDGNVCTDDVCTSGTASHPPRAPRASCLGSSLCDGQGNCVACLAATDCGVDSVCQTHVCTTDHTCDVSNVGSGTPAGTQTPGDCKSVVCDGNGGTTIANDDNDVGSDGNVCTSDTCSAGAPAFPPSPAGTNCGTGLRCDGVGVCAFSDDFEDGDANGWTQIEQTSSTPGTWTVASETGRAGVTTSDFQQTGTVNTYHYQYVPGVGPIADQTVSAWIKVGAAFADDNHKAGVCARFTTDGTNNGTSAYCFFIRQDGSATGGRLQISKKPLNGSLSGLISTTSPNFPNVTIPQFVIGTWYHFTLKVSGSSPPTLVASINDVQLRSVVDDGTIGGAPLTSGSAGLVARQVPASFDDVLVTSP